MYNKDTMMNMHTKKHDEVDRNERGDEKAGGKEHDINSLLAFSNSTSVAPDETTTVTASSNSNSSRREERLLSNRLSARDRRKRQKISNECMKKENVELKAKLQQKADEMKELKSRNLNLEYGLRQACIDNLTLLKGRMPENNSQLHGRKYAEHPTQASLLESLLLLSPAFPAGANVSSNNTPSAALNGNFPVPFNFQRPRSNTMSSVPPSSSLGQHQVQSRVDSAIQQNANQMLSNNSGEDRLLELLYLERERSKNLQHDLLQEIRQPNNNGAGVLQQQQQKLLQQHRQH